MAPAMEMSKKSIDEYTQKLRERYSRMTGRRARGKLLDEYIEVTGYERKYATKVLGGIRRKFPGKSNPLFPFQMRSPWGILPKGEKANS